MPGAVAFVFHTLPLVRLNSNRWTPQTLFPTGRVEPRSTQLHPIATGSPALLERWAHVAPPPRPECPAHRRTRPARTGGVRTGLVLPGHLDDEGRRAHHRNRAVRLVRGGDSDDRERDRCR